MSDNDKATKQDETLETRKSALLNKIQQGEDDAGEVLGEFLAAVSKVAQDMPGQVAELKTDLQEAAKPKYPNGQPIGAPGIVKGESPNTSRKYSLARYAIALSKKKQQDPDWRDYAKVEVDLSKELRQEYTNSGLATTLGPDIVPLGTDLMPTEDTELADGQFARGLSKQLVNKCSDMLQGSLDGYDPDELNHISKRSGVRKDLSHHTATTGGVLVAAPSQGELIELLRASELFSRAGAQEISLPVQGKIDFPRSTSSVTIDAFSEGSTTTESTPGFSTLHLSAKKYAGLVDIPEELIKYATSVSVEGWLRSEFARELALKADADMINGAGGNLYIQGVIQYSGLRTVIASTTGANGDTLDPEDPMLLFADIADQNAPVDRGFFYSMTNTLWASLVTRKSSQNEFVFSVGVNQVGGPGVPSTLNGYNVVPTTQIPTNRSKGSGTTLTLVLGGVGAEWLIARAGVVEVSMTDSDASKFQSGISTMRGVQYVDAGPRHEESFGMIDDLLNS